VIGGMHVPDIRLVENYTCPRKTLHKKRTARHVVEL